MSVLDEVRAAAREVASRAKHVRIDSVKIPAYAAALPIEPGGAPELDSRYHFLGTPAETVAFIVTLDSINFGSGYFPHLRKLPSLSGYFTIASRLTERFRSKGPFTAHELQATTREHCMALFQQEPDDGPVSELMNLFAKALNQLGYYLMQEFEGRFEALVEAAGQSAERLVELLAVMEFFQDVPFYKRAQLTASDLSLAFRGKGYGRFTDLDRLTIFADNLVPHVLRVDGILIYGGDLAQRIDSGQLIPAGSEEELEIRAGAVEAVELMVGALRSRGHRIRALDLDYLLWNRGQQPFYKARPRHRTRTVYY